MLRYSKNNMYFITLKYNIRGSTFLWEPDFWRYVTQNGCTEWKMEKFWNYK